MSTFDAIAMTPEEIGRLTTRPIVSYRSARYAGGRVAVRLERDFGDVEIGLIRSFYRELVHLLELTRPRPDSEVIEATRRAALEAFFGQTKLIRFAEEIEQVAISAERTADQSLAEVLREMTGGAFFGIFAAVQILRTDETDPEGFGSLYYLVRDHLKILRSLIEDLDPEGRERDEALNLHPISLMREKWDGALFQVGDRRIRVAFESSFEGHVAERCIEFAEVDRLFYHLAQNAAQHGIGKKLGCQVEVTPDKNSLRWVFINPIDSPTRRSLMKLIAEGNSLFDSGTSLNGKGWGLNVVAQSVDNAYGLSGKRYGESVGYYGVRIDPERFVVWFHWPIVAED